MAKAQPKKEEKGRSLVGEDVSFKYRSGGGKGRVVGVYKKGTTHATTGYKIRPGAASRHPGEPEFIHRLGKHLRRVLGI